MGSKHIWGIGWVLLFHAAGALGQQESSIRPSKTEVYSYSSNRGLEHPTKVRTAVSTSHASSTHGIRLQYTLGIYINTSAATPNVVQLANASIDTKGIQGLIQDFGNSLVSALGQKIAAIFPPGMKTVQVSNVQPGSPLKAEVLLYVNMNTKPDPSGLILGPCTVLQNTSNWFGNNLRMPSLSQLDPDFVSRYALSTITVTPSTENVDDMHNCSYVASYAGPVPMYVYIIVAVFGSLVFACAVYKMRIFCSDRCSAQTASNAGNAPAPAITVGPVAMRGLNSSTTGAPYSVYVQEQIPGVASSNSSNKDVGNANGCRTPAVYAESGVFDGVFDGRVSDRSNAFGGVTNPW